MNDWEIIDEDAGDSVSDEWVFPDNEFGQEAEELYDEDGEEGLESLGLEGTRDMIFFYGPLNVQFMGFPLDHDKTPNLQWSKEMYAPQRTIPDDLFGVATQPSQPNPAEQPTPGVDKKLSGLRLIIPLLQSRLLDQPPSWISGKLSNPISTRCGTRNSAK
jgi:hypothetical protein